MTAKKKITIKQVRILCRDEHGNKLTRIIDEKVLNRLQDQFQQSGGDLFALLLNPEISYESRIISLHE